MVPPCSNRISRVPPYSRTKVLSTRTGLSPSKVRLSNRFRFLIYSHWPDPRSLATTSRVSVDVLSSGYLDVSVPRVCPLAGTPCGVGFPIRKSSDQSLFAANRRLSQRITSFIASMRQDIHQMPLSRLRSNHHAQGTGHRPDPCMTVSCDQAREGHLVDALALRGDEGRSTLR